jgi:CheY-like chemotaxis protein
VELDGTFLKDGPVRPGAYVLLAVTDSGIGMDEATKDRLFEPFFTTKERGQGTGLGLATVYGIVTEAGGSINVYSELGIGATFRIYLPLVTAAESAATASARPHRAPARGDGRTVLVVEDEPALARVITRILNNGGYHVVTAANGAEALRLYGQHGCAALLTDVIMPEMSGRRLAELLRERQPGLPVLYMSGYSNGLLGTTHVIDEDIAFIEKPFTASDLLHKLAAACERSRSHLSSHTGP